MNKAIVTVGFVGLLRPAPGTWGSLVAVALAYPIIAYFPFWAFIAAIAVAYGIGMHFTALYIADDKSDPPEVVIDELVGQWLALLPVASIIQSDVSVQEELILLAVAFGFFRLFDIWKPWIIGRADAKPGAMGIMLDDVFAGLFAAIATVLATIPIALIWLSLG